jgi:hypothetical protein
MLYRVSRGNAFARFQHIDEPLHDRTTDETVSKSVFCVVLIGTQLVQKVRRLCTLLGATVYETPSSREESEAWLEQLAREVGVATAFSFFICVFRSLIFHAARQLCVHTVSQPSFTLSNAFIVTPTIFKSKKSHCNSCANSKLRSEQCWNAHSSNASSF